jgi:hypothetical protein
MRFNFPIAFGGGIGDCLLILGRFPIRWLVLLGIPCKLIYTTPGHPAEAPVKFFCESIRGCEFVTGEPSLAEKRLGQKWLAFSGRFTWIFAPPLKGFWGRRRVNPKRLPATQSLRIGFHTHLDGHHNATHVRAKIWHPENWIQLISLIKNKYQCELFLMEWNDDKAKQIQNAHPDLINLARLDLVQLSAEICKFDVLLSVDSWAKYVARWADIQQVVVLPDLRRGYTPAFEKSTAADVVRWFFHGLYKHPSVEIVGVKSQGKDLVWELDDINDLAPSELFEAFERAVTRATKAARHLKTLPTPELAKVQRLI